MAVVDQYSGSDALTSADGEQRTVVAAAVGPEVRDHEGSWGAHEEVATPSSDFRSDSNFDIAPELGPEPVPGPVPAPELELELVDDDAAAPTTPDGKGEKGGTEGWDLSREVGVERLLMGLLLVKLALLA